MKETILIRAAEIAAQRHIKAIERVKEQVLTAYEGKKNLTFTELKSIFGTYDDLIASPDKLAKLAQVYHSDDEFNPCLLCRFIYMGALKKARKEGK